MGPVGPCNPAGPLRPSIPCGPMGPVGPVAPAGPVGPVAPVGPVIDDMFQKEKNIPNRNTMHLMNVETENWTLSCGKALFYACRNR